MKLVVAKQHGAWAMLIIPFWLSALAAGVISLHFVLFGAWLMLYLFSYPFLQLQKRPNETFRRAAWQYGLIAALFIASSVALEWRLIYFGLAFVPLFVINMYYAKQNNERAVLNDFVAVVAFCLGGLASYFASAGTLTYEAGEIFAQCALFFIGSTLYVKTMIREKKSATYKWLSWGYHLLLLSGQLLYAPIVAISAVFGLGRAVLLYGRKVSIMQVGILEIVHAVLFFIVMWRS